MSDHRLGGRVVKDPRAGIAVETADGRRFTIPKDFRRRLRPGQTVTFTVSGGSIVDLTVEDPGPDRPTGSAGTGGEAPAPGTPGGDPRTGTGGGRHWPRPGRRRTTRRPDHFLNPYTFAPAPDRAGVPGPLADAEPGGHHRHRPDRWVGTLTVTVEAVTPLLIPDAARSRPHPSVDGHLIFDVREDPRSPGRPLLPPTALKGMLRSAYEVITNSRFPQLPHTRRLGHRQRTDVALRAVPARVRDHGGQRWLELMYGTDEVGTGRAGPGRSAKICIADIPEGCRHGDPVWFRMDGRTGRATGVRLGEGAGRGDERYGFLCLTGEEGRDGKPQPNFPRKRNERIFFAASDEHTAWVQLTDDLARRWTELIDDYLDAAARETGNPSGAARSRHVDERARRLSDGDLLYVWFRQGARPERANGQAMFRPSDVEHLGPVLIGRELDRTAPAELVPPSLRPARTLAELSPADRVFGWVRPTEGGSEHAPAYRGHVRIADTRCVSGGIERFDAPVVLAILNAPKPSQARFYGAADAAGTPLDDGIPAPRYGDKVTRGLRGRKLYWHHGDKPEGYWSAASGGPAREWRQAAHPGQEPEAKKTNRSITSWVRPGTRFEATLRIDGLDDTELGALVWLCDTGADDGEGCLLRFGGGKPLGFGSVRLRVEPARTRLCRGDALATWFDRPDGDLPAADEADWRATVEVFRRAVAEAAGTSFEKAPPVQALLAAGGQPHLPVHYPRLGEQPDPEGNNYEWFVENERLQKGTPAWGLALPGADERLGLPRFPRRPGGGAGPPRPGRGGRDRRR